MCARIGIDETELARRRADALVKRPANPGSDTESLTAAIQEFEAALPGWWWGVCHCALTRDASCDPDFRVLGVDHLQVLAFDDGFHDDHEGSLADALRSVLSQALEASDAKDLAG